MEQLVRVQKLNEDGTAQVLHIGQSTCTGDCHKCSGGGALQQKILFTAENPIHAQPGQVVTVIARTGPVLAVAALYLMPLALFFLSYLVGYAFWQSSALGGLPGFAIGVILAAVYDRRIARKQKTVYTITGFGRKPQNWGKGDNDLD